MSAIDLLSALVIYSSIYTRLAIFWVFCQSLSVQNGQDIKLNVWKNMSGLKMDLYSISLTNSTAHN